MRITKKKEPYTPPPFRWRCKECGYRTLNIEKFCPRCGAVKNG